MMGLSEIIMWLRNIEDALEDINYHQEAEIVAGLIALLEEGDY